MPDANLRPGAFARAEVTISNAERAVLPQTAVLTDDKGSYVLMVNSQGKVERRAVQVSGMVQSGVTISRRRHRIGSGGGHGRRFLAGGRGGETGGRDRRQVVKNISAWAIRHPVTPIVLFVVLFFMGIVAFIRLPINLESGCFLSAGRCHHFAARRGAARNGDADCAEGRRLDLQYRQRAQYHDLDRRGADPHDRGVPDRHPHRSRGHGCARCHRQGPQRFAAGHSGTAGGPRRRRRRRVCLLRIEHH